jgi:hypothetical protein
VHLDALLLDPGDDLLQFAAVRIAATASRYLPT